MTLPLLLVTEVPIEPSATAEAATAWRTHLPEASLYLGVEDSTLLELTPLAGFADLDACTAAWDDLFKTLTPLLRGDIRRQLVRFVDAPKPAAGDLPDTPYVQLRHVEVKPPKLEEYLSWREDTIFDVVRTSPATETFLAYHSLLSTEPGVLFVAGFRSTPEEFTAPYLSSRYAEIAEYAHARFITDAGLYTRIYRRLGDLR